MPEQRPCRCPQPLVLDDSGRCHRCGLVHRLIVTAGTMRLAIAIAEVLKGKRRIGDSKHRKS